MGQPKPEWDDGLPGWHDILSTAEVEWEDGRRLIGELDYDDMTSGPDEYPICFLRMPDGSKVGISDSSRYRIIATSRY